MVTGPSTTIAVGVELLRAVSFYENRDFESTRRTCEIILAKDVPAPVKGQCRMILFLVTPISEGGLEHVRDAITLLEQTLEEGRPAMLHRQKVERMLNNAKAIPQNCEIAMNEATHGLAAW